MIETRRFFGAECETMLSACFPQDSQQSFVKITLAMIRESHEYFKRYRNPSRETKAHHRRGLMEDYLQGLGESSIGVSVSIENYEGESGSYTMLESGIMQITQSRTDRRELPPRQANFRDSLSTNQDNFFEEMIPKDGHLYGILVYRVNKNDITPDYIGIGFPNFSGSGWAHYVDLLERFGQELNINSSDPVIDSEVSLDIKLKK